MKALSAGTFFSGVGGADMGLVAAGMVLHWACEIDRKARAVFRRHFPGVPIHHDIKELRGATLEPVDVLFFGSPCQDLSIAGRRAGLSGERSGLFFHAMRVVDEMAVPPRIAVWENVRGALSSNGGEDFATVLTEMGKRWSGIAYRVLDLQYFGPPQRRERVFVVGHSGGWQRAAAVLFEPEGVRWNPPARQKPGKTAPTIPSRGSGGGGLGTDFDLDGGVIQAFGGNNTSGPIQVASRVGCNESGSGYRIDFESDTLVTHSLRGEGADASEDGTGRGTPLVPVSVALRGREGGGAAEISGDVATALRSSQGGGDKPHVLAPVAFDTTQITSPNNRCSPRPGDACHPLASSAHPPALVFQDRFRGDDGRGYDRPPQASNNTIGALETVKPWNVVHSMQVRRLTPVECHRLMGWPDDWCAWGVDDNGHRITLKDGPQYKMIGNGVGKPHAEWIGSRINEVEREAARAMQEAVP